MLSIVNDVNLIQFVANHLLANVLTLHGHWYKQQNFHGNGPNACHYQQI